MIQQMAGRCDQCSGQGSTINEKDKCRKCNGTKTVQEQKILEVNISPGMRENQKIVFHSEGDQEPGIEPGDVILVVQCKNHDLFERKDDDLFMRKKISLNEALCGFTTVIKHLDGRHLVLSTQKGAVIKPESIQMVTGEGMPIPNSMERGNLYVIFEVEFPNNHFLSEQDYKKLEGLLPARPKVQPPVCSPDLIEEVSLHEYDEHRYERKSGKGREAYHDDSDSDDEVGGSGRQHVQCAQQ